MAKAKKLKSGNWRCLVYDYTDSNGKRHYESFTAETRKEAEFLAAQFALDKKNNTSISSTTLREAIKLYIEESKVALSPTTIAGYEKILRNSFQDLLDTPLKKINKDLLQDAVNKEALRPSQRSKTTTISPKTLRNSYGLIVSVIHRYQPNVDCNVKLPAKKTTIKELLPAETIISIVKNTDIELPVLLAMWLSFSMSEIRGIRKSDIINGYVKINQVKVDVNCNAIIKDTAKTLTRIRKHKLPTYILNLINNQTNNGSDMLITASGHSIYMKWKRLLEKNNLPHMTFHDLRHVNASVMALLKIPDKYAMERGGWKTDAVMKKVYTHTFSEEREKVDKIIDDYFESIL